MKLAKGKRVADIGSPDFPGTVVTSGDQVSEVRWDDIKPRGTLQFIPNDKLIGVQNGD